MDYNNNVKQINTATRVLPTSIIAALTGVKQREYFQIEETAKNVPTVKF